MGRREYIYVIKSGLYYKIGKTMNIKQRMKAIQYANPIKIELKIIQAISHCATRERDIHDRFDSKRVRGEWFRLTKKDIKDLQRLVSIFKAQDDILEKIFIRKKK